MELPAISTEYVYVGVTGAVPSGDAEVAFKTSGAPIEADWETAIKVTEEHSLWTDASSRTGLEGDWFVAILVGAFGTGGIELTAATYTVWVRLTDATEQPVRSLTETLVIT